MAMDFAPGRTSPPVGLRPGLDFAPGWTSPQVGLRPKSDFVLGWTSSHVGPDLVPDTKFSTARWEVPHLLVKNLETCPWFVPTPLFC